MLNAMDGVSLVRSGDHHTSNNVEDSKKKRKKRTVVTSVVPIPTLPLPSVDLLMEENSNGSSISNGTSGKDEVEGDEMPELDSATTGSSKREGSPDLTPSLESSNSGSLHSRSSSHRHGSSHNNHNASSVHHHHHSRRIRSTPRANYQFETPADESRGTFPDDFDEELFISGQLVETSNEAPGFDEEMESNHQDPDEHDHHSNHLNHQINLETADHSESSDIEDSLYSAGTNATTSSTTPPTNNSTNNSSSSSSSSSSSISTSSSRDIGKSKLESNNCLSGSSTSRKGSSYSPIHEHYHLPLSSSITTLIVNGNGISSAILEPPEEPMHEDLSSSDNADEPSQPETQGNISASNNDNNGLIPDYSPSPYYYSHDEQDHNDGVNDLEDVKPDISTPVRKRKGALYNVELPEKKPLTVVTKPEPEEYDTEETGDDYDYEVHERSKSNRLVIPTKENPPAGLGDWLNVFTNWGHAERLMAINELIHTCEPTQVRHMMKVIEPQFQRDFISLLPKELALYVLSFLEPKDLLRAAQTCRYWRILCDDNLLWREKCKEAGIGYFNAMSQRVHKRSRASQTSCSNCVNENTNNCSNNNLCNEPPSQPNMSRWKAAFLRQHNVEMNWRFQPIKPTKILKGHDDHVITCLQFSANRIVSGSDDNTLKVWSANTGKCLRTLMGHTGGVWSSQMSGTTIVSGSTDRTLRVWNAETGTCLHTLYGHTSTVRCMHLYGRKVVSGSRDATLRVWDVDSGECLHVLVGHMAAVRCVQYNGTIVVSGAYDFMVRVWDVEREECLHQLQGHSNRVYSLQFDGIHVVSGSLDTSIRVWDVKTGACKHTLMGHQSLTSGMELRENLLVSGNADSTVKIWDINTGQCLLTLSGAHKHLSAVTCLQLINKFVITSSDDGTVKLWDIKTGEFVRNLVTLTSGGSGGVVWRIRASETKLVCAVGSRNGTEETKLLVLDFDVEPFIKCDSPLKIEPQK